MLTSFHRKSKIIKYSLDLPLECMTGKHYVLWRRVAYRVIALRSDSAEK